MAAMKKNDSLSNSDNSRRWKRRELGLLILYAIVFYFIVIRRSLHISRGNQKFHYHWLPNSIFHFICFKMFVILDSTNSQIITPDSTVYARDGSRNWLIFPTYLLSALPPLFVSILHKEILYFPLLQDVSDAQWRNFRGNLPILTFVFGIFALVANTLRAYFDLKARGMSIVWLFISLIYLSYLHGAWYAFFIHNSML